VCLANNSMLRANGLVAKHLSEEITPDGSYVVRTQSIPIAQANAASLVPADLSAVPQDPDFSATIGLPAFQTVEYGLACAFEYLGAQAQLLLDNVGDGVIEYLEDAFSTKLEDGPERSLKALAAFYLKQGLADGISVDLSASEIHVRFRNYRYAPVLTRLLDEDHPFTSCPFTLAARSALRKSGWAVRATQWVDLDAQNVTLRMLLRRVTDEEFDELKIAEMMETR